MSDSNNYILLQFIPKLFQNYLRHKTGETLALHFHQQKILRDVIPMNNLLVQRQSTVGHSYTVDDVFSSDCRYSSDLTPQNTSELQKILSARHIFHNSPCPHAKRQDPAHWTRRLSRMVGIVLF